MLPHEAEEHEETNGHFGMRRRSESDLESDEDEFDDEEDVPRIRGDDHETDAILAGLLPGDLPEDVIRNGEASRGNRLLEEDNGTPGLLSEGRRGRGVEDDVDDDDAESDDIAMSDDISENDEEDQELIDGDSGAPDGRHHDATPTRVQIVVEGVDGSQLDDEEGAAAFVEGLLGQQLLALDGFPADDANFLNGSQLGHDSDQLEDEEDNENDDDDNDEDDEDEDVDGDEDETMDLGGNDIFHSFQPRLEENETQTIGSDVLLGNPSGVIGGSMSSFYFSIPSREARHHQQHSNTVTSFSSLSNPLDGVTRVDTIGSWTAPGDLALPSFHPILSFSRTRQSSQQQITTSSGAVSSQLGANPRIPGATGSLLTRQQGSSISIRSTFFEQRGNDQEPTNSRATASRPTVGLDHRNTRLPIQLVSALSQGQLLFDPWSTLVLTRAGRNSSGTAQDSTNSVLASRRSSAAVTSIRPPPSSPEMESYERAGVNAVMDRFLEWTSLAAASGTLQRRLCTLPPSATPLPESMTRVGGVAQGIPPINEEDHVITHQELPTTAEQQSAEATPSGSESHVAAPMSDLPEQLPPSTPEQRMEDEDTEMVPDPAGELHFLLFKHFYNTLLFVAVASDVATEIQRENRVQVDHIEGHEEISRELPIEDSMILERLEDQEDQEMHEPPRDSGTLEEYYYIIRNEEIIEPLGLQCIAIRNLALCLGLTQEQLLHLLGIDPEFLAALPSDMQQEVIGQTARNISIEDVTAMRVVNLSSLEEMTLVVDSHPAPSPSDPDAIRFLPEENITNREEESFIIVEQTENNEESEMHRVNNRDTTTHEQPFLQQQPNIDPSAPPVDSSNTEMTDHDCTAVQDVIGESNSSSRNDVTTTENQVNNMNDSAENSITRSNTDETIPVSRRRIDPASCRVPPDVLRTLSSDIRRVVNETLCRGPEISVRSGTQSPSTAVRGTVDLDNATFIATLDPQLRQELLLTAADEDLRALPPEYVAEAALLRDRARHEHHTGQEPQTSRSTYMRRPQLIRTEQQRRILSSDRPPGTRSSGISVNAPPWARLPGLQRDMTNLYNAIFSVLQPLRPPPGAAGVTRSAATGGRSNLIPGNVSPEVMDDGMDGISLRSTHPAITTNNLTITTIPGNPDNPVGNLMDQILQDFGMSFEIQTTVDDLRGVASRHQHPSRLIRSLPIGGMAGSDQRTVGSNTVTGIFPFFAAGQYSRDMQGGSQGQRHLHRIPADLASFLHSAIPPFSSIITATNRAGPTLRNNTFDFAPIPIRPPSMVDIPVEPLSILAAIRLLYLKRQIYRRDMHRLFLALAASHPTARRQLLQLLMVVVWSCAIDVQNTQHLPIASINLQSLGFPPRRLYCATDLPASLLFDNDPEATSSIAAYRALEHTRSLLEVVPQVAEFFGTLVPHPAFVEVLTSSSQPRTLKSPRFPLGSPSVDSEKQSVSAIKSSNNEDEIMTDVTETCRHVPEADVETTMQQEMRRKKKKRDSDQPTIWDSCTTPLNSSIALSTQSDSKTNELIKGPMIVSRTLRGRLKRRLAKETKEEYPINVLLVRFDSIVF